MTTAEPSGWSPDWRTGSTPSTIAATNCTAKPSGRLESRLRFSNTYSYNNFPLPDLKPRQREAIVAAAAQVVLARADHPDMSLHRLQAALPLVLTMESSKLVGSYVDPALARLTVGGVVPTSACRASTPQAVDLRAVCGHRPRAHRAELGAREACGRVPCRGAVNRVMLMSVLAAGTPPGPRSPG